MMAISYVFSFLLAFFFLLFFLPLALSFSCVRHSASCSLHSPAGKQINFSLVVKIFISSPIYMRTKRERAIFSYRIPVALLEQGAINMLSVGFAQRLNMVPIEPPCTNTGDDIMAVSLADKTQYVSLSALTPEALKTFIAVVTGSSSLVK